MRQPLLHLATQVFDSPLAILPEKLDVLLQYVGPRLALDDAALQELRASGLFAPTAGFGSDRFSRSQEEKPYQVTDAGIAIIPISGVLLKKGGFMSALSGCSSYESIRAAVTMAKDDNQVRGLLFDVNSPGGTTHGMFDLADLIYGMRGGGKPMYASANDLSASAAYILTSAADKVFVTRTAGIGSVGVYALHVNTSAADKAAGVQYTYVKFGAKKTDGNEHEPVSKSALADIQQEVDREGAMFVTAVARNRATTYDAIAATEAGVMFAEGACPLLADAVGTFEDALAEITSVVTGSSDTIPKGKRRAENPGAPIQGEGADEMPITAEMRAQMRADLEAEIRAQLKAEQECADADEMEAKKKAKAKSKPPMPADDDADDKAAKAAAQLAQDNLTALAARATANEQIAEMCMLAGEDAMATKFISEKATVADVRKALLDKRAAKSAEAQINPAFGTVSTDALDSVVKQANAMTTNSNGAVAGSKAFEAALRTNPALYMQYDNERAIAALTPMGIQKYVREAAARMPALGLSAQIGS